MSMSSVLIQNLTFEEEGNGPSAAKFGLWGGCDTTVDSERGDKEGHSEMLSSQ